MLCSKGTATVMKGVAEPMYSSRPLHAVLYCDDVHMLQRQRREFEAQLAAKERERNAALQALTHDDKPLSDEAMKVPQNLA